MRRFLLLILLMLTIVEAAIANLDEEHELKEIEVRASRNKIQNNLIRPVTTISSLEIEQMAVTSIDELLNFIVGVDVRSRGIHGTQSDISVRGGSFDQVLILLNGINITDPQTGHHNLNIPVEPEDISRIEVLHGSAARSFGVNAFSGAINIITNENEDRQVSARTEAGSFDYLANKLSGNFSNKKIQLFSSVSNKRAKGHIENSDFNITNTMFQVSFKEKSESRFNMQLAYQQKEFGANSFYSQSYPNQFEASKTFLTALDYMRSSGDALFKVQLYHRRHYDRFELFRNFEGAGLHLWYTAHNYHRTDIIGLKGNAIFENNLGRSTVIIDLRNEDILSNVLGESLKKTKKAGFEKDIFYTHGSGRLLNTLLADHSFSYKNWDFSGGSALMYSKQFGFHSFNGVDAAYRFNRNLRLFTTLNSAIRLPTFTDLYYQSAIHSSNPELKPEKSLNIELGTHYLTAEYLISATAFYRRGKNIIDWVKPVEAEKWESRNHTLINTLGADTEIEYRFKSGPISSAGIAYSFLYLDKDASEYDSKYALDYLRNKLSIKLDHNMWHKLTAQWNFAWFERAGNYADPVSGKITAYSPYPLLNGKLQWRTENLEIYSKATNILNYQYVDFGGILLPGFQLNFGIKIKLTNN